MQLCIYCTVHAHDSMWVSPFGYLRIIARLQLPAAFRSLPRPSSAPNAKAFALRPFQLDLIVRILLLSLGYCSFFLPSRVFLKLLLPLCFAVYCSIFKVPLVGSNGLEPSTSRLSGVRSNHLSYEPSSVVEMRRIELLTSCLQGRRSPI